MINLLLRVLVVGGRVPSPVCDTILKRHNQDSLLEDQVTINPSHRVTQRMKRHVYRLRVYMTPVRLKYQRLADTTLNIECKQHFRVGRTE